MTTTVVLHAHPDDEAITTADTMAALGEPGYRVRPPVPDPFEGPRQHGLSGLLGSSGPEGCAGVGGAG